ncbi:thioredoxin family protein [Vagococcus xieshaowenii]|uniref:Thioredoxin n=1 Tax=Vagococcus xieshaowenii TaxID=2562451 RepID=A0AAJ5EEA5_9ENTE|nr:thioredoxin family protein [Vagococcus xieshaowenii]QCA29028.1 thioredoxin [Vagococcus xieshaowenii]TFZ40996.1 thioredoxin [Vagococcus xieshaowenii]
MIKPTSLEHLAELINTGKHVLFFTANWCGDCVFIKPHLPEIMANFPELSFVEVDRDQFLDACIKMNVMGIPSFIIVDKGQELGRFVSKDRKTKAEVIEFITPFY